MGTIGPQPGARIQEEANSEGDVLLEVRRLRKYFPVTSGVLFQRRVGLIKAVDDVSFSIRKGETLGLVGESGSGKTTWVVASSAGSADVWRDPLRRAGSGAIG